MKSKIYIISLVIITSLVLSGCCGKTPDGYRIIDGVITFDTPDRAAGQQSVLGLRHEPMDVVRIGVVGLGMRGPGAVNRFTHIEGAEIVALCDLLPQRVTSVQKILERAGLPLAAEYSGQEGWRELCDRDDLDLIYIVTPWQNHVEIASYAMERGKHVAVEVPAATSVAECWTLVDVAERTQRHCMMLENCVYDFFELTTLNMAQHGLFGEILHTEGAYIHDLTQYWSHYQGNWRLDFNQKHGGDVYATHGLGPACQLLDIHRGDKMNYLVAMATQSVNGLEVAREQMGVEEFANPDHTLTLIQTARGRTIHLQHNVYTPRPYSRMYQLTGTDGFANKYPVEGYAFHPEAIADAVPDHEDLNSHNFVSAGVKKELMTLYKHPIVVDIEDKARQVGGHGGMDFIMDYRLIYCLRNGLPLDQDVYDAAEWSCIGELTAASIANNSAPVAVPDFTRGDWNKIEGYRHALVE